MKYLFKHTDAILNGGIIACVIAAGVVLFLFINLNS